MTHWRWFCWANVLPIPMTSDKNKAEALEVQRQRALVTSAPQNTHIIYKTQYIYKRLCAAHGKTFITSCLKFKIRRTLKLKCGNISFKVDILWWTELESSVCWRIITLTPNLIYLFIFKDPFRIFYFLNITQLLILLFIIDISSVSEATEIFLASFDWELLIKLLIELLIELFIV